jgi:hypothetical protein
VQADYNMAGINNSTDGGVVSVSLINSQSAAY